MYEPDYFPADDRPPGVRIDDYIPINAPEGWGWGAFTATTEASEKVSTEAIEDWMADSLVSGTLHDRHSRMRIVQSTPEREGCSATGHEHSQFYDVYPCPDMRKRILPYNSDKRGPETVEYGRMLAEMQTRTIVEFANPKWRIIRPDRRVKLYQWYAAAGGEYQARIDHANVKYVNYDRFRLALAARSLVSEQQNETGVLGRLSRYVTSFFDTHASAAGPADRLTGFRDKHCYFKPDPFPELAASLLVRPTEEMKEIYRRNPEAGRVLRDQLEAIAEATGDDDLTQRERAVMTQLIRHHLADSDVEKIYDFRMLQYVAPGDPRFIEAGQLKKTFVTVHRIVCGETGEMPKGTEGIIFPLAVQMRHRNIPITVENVIEEADAILEARETLQHLVTSFVHQRERGGKRGILSFADENDLEIINDLSREARAILIRDVAGASTQIPIYLEQELGDAQGTRTMYGPRMTGGTSMRSGSSSGGYRQQGSRELIPLDMRSRDRGSGPERLLYSPYTEGHDLLYKTRIRKFRVPW